MTQPSEATAPAPPAGKLPRTGLLVAAIAAVVIAAVVAVVVTAGGSHQRTRGVTSAAA
ncbi:MAG: hypothetical protein JWM66_1187, partial [Solirubrobacterales bacterium]|nr:hypothetical protein [Solirubrobacterales bacterium]